VEDIFQGGQSIIEPIQTKAKPKDGIQKMMMRGNRIERPDYLGEGQELQDMSIDLFGMFVLIHLHPGYEIIRDGVGKVLMTRYSFTYKAHWQK